MAKAPKEPKVFKNKVPHKKVNVVQEGFDNIIDPLTKEMKLASSSMNRFEARYLIKTYYQHQNDRIRANAQARARQADGAPSELITWLATNDLRREKYIANILGLYAKGHLMSEWLLSVHGIGPIIAAALIAYIDIEKATTFGHILSYAGQQPGAVWGKGELRPWNPHLKTACWKIGESFTKVSGNEEAFYGQIYKKRKALEWSKNIAGDFAHRADEALAAKKFGVDTDAIKWYTGQFSGIIRSANIAEEDTEIDVGEKEKKQVTQIRGIPAVNGNGVKMLPPAHIHARAKKHAVKIFLAHLHQVWYETHYRRPIPVPYAITFLDHVHIHTPWNYTPKPFLHDRALLPYQERSRA